MTCLVGLGVQIWVGGVGVGAVALAAQRSIAECVLQGPAEGTAAMPLTFIITAAQGVLAATRAIRHDVGRA